MVFSCVDLFLDSADAGFILANDHEQVLGGEADLLVVVDNFYVSEALAVGAYFVLAFDNHNATWAKDAPCFLAGVGIQGDDCLVVASAGFFGIVGYVVAAEGSVHLEGG